MLRPCDHAFAVEQHARQLHAQPARALRHVDGDVRRLVRGQREREPLFVDHLAVRLDGEHQRALGKIGEVVAVGEGQHAVFIARADRLVRRLHLEGAGLEPPV